MSKNEKCYSTVIMLYKDNIATIEEIEIIKFDIGDGISV